MKNYIRQFGESPKVSLLIDEVAGACGAVFALLFGSMAYFRGLGDTNIPGFWGHIADYATPVAVYTVLSILFSWGASKVLWKRFVFISFFTNIIFIICVAVDNAWWGIPIFFSALSVLYLANKSAFEKGYLGFLVAYPLWILILFLVGKFIF